MLLRDSCTAIKTQFRSVVQFLGCRWEAFIIKFIKGTSAILNPSLGHFKLEIRLFKDEPCWIRSAQDWLQGWPGVTRRSGSASGNPKNNSTMVVSGVASCIVSSLHDEAVLDK